MNKHFGAHSNKSIRNATNVEVAEAVVENIFGGQATCANAVEGTIPVDWKKNFSFSQNWNLKF